MNEVNSEIREYVCRNCLDETSLERIFDISFFCDDKFLEKIGRFQSVVADFCDTHMDPHKFEFYFSEYDYLYFLILKIRVIYLHKIYEGCNSEIALAYMINGFKESLEQVYADQTVDRFNGLPLKDDQKLVVLDERDLEMDIEEFLNPILDVFAK